jgi:hypothetical protein
MRRSASEVIRELEMRIAELEKEAKESYPWDDCMKDQMEQYGNEETAAKVCGKIKAQSQGLGKYKSASVTERDVIDAMNKFKSLYEAGFLDRATYESHWDRLQDQLADFRLEDDLDDPSVPKIGDILYSSWGYNMTIVDFYKVLAVSPSGKSITLQRLQSDVVDGDAGYSGHVMPSRHEDRREKPIKNKRVSPSRDGYSVKIDSSANAYKWDGKKKYFNRMD